MALAGRLAAATAGLAVGEVAAGVPLADDVASGVVALVVVGGVVPATGDCDAAAGVALGGGVGVVAAGRLGDVGRAGQAGTTRRWAGRARLTGLQAGRSALATGRHAGRLRSAGRRHGRTVGAALGAAAGAHDALGALEPAHVRSGLGAGSDSVADDAVPVLGHLGRRALQRTSRQRRVLFSAQPVEQPEEYVGEIMARTVLRRSTVNLVVPRDP